MLVKTLGPPDRIQRLMLSETKHTQTAIYLYVCDQFGFDKAAGLLAVKDCVDSNCIKE